MIALVLWYLKSSDRQHKQSPKFVIFSSSLSVLIDHGPKVFLSIYIQKRHYDLRVEWPTKLEMEYSTDRLKENRQDGQLLANIFGVLRRGRLQYAGYIDINI